MQLEQKATLPLQPDDHYVVVQILHAVTGEAVTSVPARASQTVQLIKFRLAKMKPELTVDSIQLMQSGSVLDAATKLNTLLTSKVEKDEPCIIYLEMLLCQPFAWQRLPLEHVANHTMKVMLVGLGAVGKTSLIQLFTSGAYEEAYTTTDGVERLAVCLKGEPGIVSMQIASRGYRKGAPACDSDYRSSDAFVIVVDLTNRESFSSAEGFLCAIQDRSGSEYIAVVATKCDLENERVVSRSELEYLARVNNLKSFEVSCKLHLSVEEPFFELLTSWLGRKAHCPKPAGFLFGF